MKAPRYLRRRVRRLDRRSSPGLRLVLLGLSALLAAPAFAEVEPAFYAVGRHLSRLTEEEGARLALVETFLSNVRAAAVAPDGDLIAVGDRGEVYEVEPQTGDFESVAQLGLGLGAGPVDVAFDPLGNFWLALPFDGQTYLYRFDPDFGGRTRVVDLPFEAAGLAFRFGELVVFADRSLYTVDLETSTPELLAGPFPDEGIYGASSVHFSGLDATAGGRLFTIASEFIPIAPPMEFTYFLELELEDSSLRLLGDIAPGAGPAIRLEGCDPDERTICLRSGRFEATVDWQQPGAGLREARRTRFITRDSGVFSFLGPDNLEVTIKVLDACDYDGHFWVFAASATSLEHEITVSDTFAGETRTYLQPSGGARPVTDVRAFATCP